MRVEPLRVELVLWRAPLRRSRPLDLARPLDDPLARLIKYCLAGGDFP
jgi:hypothetical protein